VVISDQWVKRLAAIRLSGNDSIPIIKGLLYFTYTVNHGIVFGILNNLSPLFFIILTIFIIAMLLIFLKGLRTHPGFAVLLGGIAGNFIDRIRLGYTIDFIDFRFWPVFNISDICICVGVALLFLYIIRNKDILIKN